MKKTLGVLAILLCLCSCSRKAVVDMSVEALGEEKLALYKMDVANSQLLDTVKTDKNGHFRYSVTVEKGQPEFVYVYRGDVRLASLLLEKPGKVEVKADTLGNYSVIGSESSEQFRLVEKEYADFISQMRSCEDNASAVKTYINYYRGRLNYVLQNSKSMVVVPVLFQTLSEGVPVFSQNTDAIVFRQVCDSLKTVYPQSRFVRALEAALWKECWFPCARRNGGSNTLVRLSAFAVLRRYSLYPTTMPSIPSTVRWRILSS